MVGPALLMWGLAKTPACSVHDHHDHHRVDLHDRIEVVEGLGLGMP